jgi:integrase
LTADPKEGYKLGYLAFQIGRYPNFMALTEAAVRGAKPGEKPYKLYDDSGLYLLVHPRGSKYWRLKYMLEGREMVLALGVYPDVGLAAARSSRNRAREELASGVDLAAQRRAKREGRSDTFQSIAREWLERQPFTPKTLKKAQWTFNDLIFRYIGKWPIRAIKPTDVLDVVRRLEKRGKIETAHRTKQRIGQVCRFAIATGRADRDPTQDLRGALAPLRVTNRAAITEPKRVGELLKAIDGYQGFVETEFALKLAPLLFVRPGELRYARWEEIDLESDDPEWRIPAAKMKMRRMHIVPLSRQASALLKELQGHEIDSPYVFPSHMERRRPISENTLGAALRRMGFSNREMTAHGFRAMASTLLNERGYHPDLIELQLAHAERNEVRAAYNRAVRLSERREMMQDWADYLDTLRQKTSEEKSGRATKSKVRTASTERSRALH